MPFPPQSLVIHQGTCYALFAYDVGWAIDLAEAERRIAAGTERGRLRSKTRAPQYFEYRPLPLRLIQEGGAFAVGAYQSSPTVEVMVYDFGAVTITYRFPLEGPSEPLLELSESLYEHEPLLAASRTRVEHLVQAILPAIERPKIADEVEDYVIISIDSYSATGPAPWKSNEAELARILRGERTPLSDQEIADATSCRISFGLDDAALIDWHAAVLFGKEMDDVRAVLEFANVELLEMRILDEQLDKALDEGYEGLTRKSARMLALPGSFEQDTTHIAQLQVDAALLFERVTNTLKLLGDQYLARVYRLASQRFHLESWDASILRKLQTLESIYDKMSNRAATRRMEVLEWIIIVLIAVSIIVSVIPLSTH